MATNNNRELTKEIINRCNLQISRDAVPNKIGDAILPVIDVNPEHNRKTTFLAENVCANATSATVFTTSSIRDTYITAIQFTMIKDATSTSTYSTLNAVIEGASKTLIIVREFSLTAQSANFSLTLPSPMKIDRNTAVTLTHSTNVANISSDVVVYGYEVDVN